MKVLIVGSGGREDALAWRFSIDPRVVEVATVPGNLGTLRWGRNFDGEPLAAARYFQPDLIVIGPEEPLEAGLADILRAEAFTVLGPGRDGARIESSKSWAKAFMRRHGIPCADEVTVDARPPFVVKRDGLARGKGVIVARDREEAISFMNRHVPPFVIEEYLDGEEVTLHALVSGRRFHILPAARDYKRLLDDDRGPNTGGMGAVSPVDAPTEIIERVVEALADEGIDYCGILYIGLMIVDGESYVLEFNCRFGDPEAQAILPRIEGDWARACLGEPDAKLTESPRATTCVVVASEGYPDAPKTGRRITGRLPAKWETKNAVAFLNGVQRETIGVTTSGGRVASIVGFGDSSEESRIAAYDAIDQISFEGMQYRRDIR